MYREFLNKAIKSHYEYTDVFEQSPFCWIRAFVKESYNIEMHSQAFYEINIIIRGEGIHYIEDKRIAVKRGDIFVIPPRVHHGYSSNPELDVYHLLIHEQFFIRYNDELEAQSFYHELFQIEPLMRADGTCNLHLQIDDDKFNLIKESMNNLVKWSSLTDNKSIVLSNTLALMVIIILCDLYHEHHQNLLPRKAYRVDTNFMNSISFIYDHYSQKITTKQLAEIAFLSRNAYILRFKRVMHTTPACFIMDYRLKKAKELLIQTNMSILDIASHTGFYDLSHFSRSFIKRNPYSPMLFRKNHR